MELQCVLGLRCNDFAMIAADQMRINSIIVMKDDDVKIHKITDNLLVGVAGDQGDTAQFVQYIAKNVQLYRMRNQYALDIGAVAHFTKRNLAEARLRGVPYAVTFLLAGYDETKGGQLYYLDPLGACISTHHTALGVGGMLSLSIMDWWYKPVLTETEAYDILKMCAQEIHQRLFVQLPKFQVSLVSKHGIKELPPIVPQII